MSVNKFIRTEKREDGRYFDMFQTFTPLTEEEKQDLVIQQDELFVDVPLFKRGEREQLVSEQEIVNRYANAVKVNNDSVDSKIAKINQVSDLEADLEELTKVIEDNKVKLDDYEEMLPEDKHLPTDEVSEGEETIEE